MKYQKNVYHAAVMITQFGINMLVPIFLCTFVGIWLDKKLGTQWIMVVLFFVGAMAGARNIYVFAKRVFSMQGDARNRDVGTALKQSDFRVLETKDLDSEREDEDEV